MPRQEWRQAAEQRERAYSTRVMDKAVHLTRGSKQLHKLQLGQHVQIQDQNKASKTFKQWTKTGIVVNVGDHDDYQVSVDGSRYVTKRNRQFLKPFNPAPAAWSIQTKQPPHPPNIVPHHPPQVSEQPHDVPVQQHDVPDPTPQPLPPQDNVPEVHPDPSLILKFRRRKHDPEDWELVRPAVPPQPQQLSTIAPHHVQYQYPSTQFVSSFQYPVLSSPQANGIPQQEHWPTIPTHFSSPYQSFYPTFPISGQQNMHNMMATYPQGYSSYSTNQ